MDRPTPALFDSLDEIVTLSEAWDAPGKLAAFSTLTIMFREIEAYTQNEDHQVDSRGYAIEKLATVHAHLRAAYGLDPDASLPMNQQFDFIHRAIDSIRRGILGDHQ